MQRPLPYGSFLWLVLGGSLLHSLYAFAGWTPLAYIVPANESVWEHFKMGAVAMVLQGVWQRMRTRPVPPSFWTARLVGILALNGTIAVIFPLYTALTGRSIVIVDILSYVLGAIVAALLVRALESRAAMVRHQEAAAVLVIASILGLFAVFTAAPPHAAWFRDGRTGAYGLSVPAPSVQGGGTSSGTSE
jgi:hypothetical protein